MQHFFCDVHVGGVDSLCIIITYVDSVTFATKMMASSLLLHGNLRKSNKRPANEKHCTHAIIQVQASTQIHTEEA